MFSESNPVQPADSHRALAQILWYIQWEEKRWYTNELGRNPIFGFLTKNAQ